MIKRIIQKWIDDRIQEKVNARFKKCRECGSLVILNFNANEVREIRISSIGRFDNSYYYCEKHKKPYDTKIEKIYNFNLDIDIEFKLNNKLVNQEGHLLCHCGNSHYPHQ